ncbi:MAG: PAS domain S-box protein [bacterium]|nr:PAS domain S-box protein [bacterium]
MNLLIVFVVNDFNFRTIVKDMPRRVTKSKSKPEPTLKKLVHILLVEDNDDDALLIERNLKQAGIHFFLSRVETKLAFLQELKRFNPDLVISDYTLPEFDGLTALHLLKKSNQSIPFILVTQSLSEELASEFMKAGADDCILKSQLQKLPSLVRTIAEKKQSEPEKDNAIERILANRELTRQIIDMNPVGIAIVNRSGQITYANAQAEKVLGLKKSHILQRTYNAPEWKITDFNGQPFPESELPFFKVKTTHKPVFDIRHAIEWPNGNRVFLSINGIPLFNPFGEFEGMLATVENITEREQTIQAIQESETRYRLLFESNPLPMWVYDLATLQFLAVNDAAVARYGYTREEFLQMTIKEIWFEEDIPSLLSNLAHITVGLDESGLWRHRTKDGSIIYVEITSHTLLYSGRPAELVLAQDVTARIQSEEKIRLLSNAVRSVNDCVIITDMQNRIIFVNEPFEKNYGYTQEEILGKPREILVPEFEQQKFTHSILADTIQKGFWHGELWNKRKDGTFFPSWVSTAYIRNEQHQPTAILEITYDITERKKTETDLLRHIELENLIISVSNQFINLPSGEIDSALQNALQVIGTFVAVDRSYVFLFSEDGEYMSNTHEWCAPDISSKKTRLQNIPTDTFPWLLRKLNQREEINISRVVDLPREAEAEKQEFLTENIQSLLVVPLVYKKTIIGFVGFDSVKKERRWLADEVALLRIVGEIFTSAIQQKKTEEALALAVNQWRTTFDAMRDLICLLDANGNIIRCNVAFCEYLQRPFLEILGKNVCELFFGNQEPPADFPFIRIHRTRKRELGTIFINRRWFDITVDPMVDATGALLGAVQVMQDVTELKQRELVDKHKQEQLVRYQSALLSLAKMEFSSLDLALNRITEIDAQTLNIARVSFWQFNRERNEIICKDLYCLADHTHQQGQQLQSIRYPRYFRALDENRMIAASDAQNDLRTNEFNEGYLKPLRIMAMLDVPVRLRGVVVGILCHEHTGSIREWTVEEQEFAAQVADMVSLALAAEERNRAEAELFETHQRYLKVITQAKAVPYQRDYLTNEFTIVGEEIETLTGYSKEEFTAQLFDKLVQESILYGEAAGLSTEEAIQQIRAGEIKQWHAEYRITTKSGETKWLSDASIQLRDETGKAIGSLGILQDITEHKRAEETIRRTHELYQEAISQADAVPYFFDYVNNCYGFMGERIEYLTGYPVAEFTPSLWKTLIQEVVMLGETVGMPIDEAGKLARAGKINKWRAEYRITTKSGETKWLTDSAIQLFDAQGNVTGFLGFLQDITDRKLAEEKQRETHELYRQALIQADAVPYLLDYITNRYIFIGEGIERLTEYTTLEITPQIWRSLIQETIVYGEDTGLPLEIVSQRARNGAYKKWRAEYKITTKTGKTRWLSDSSIHLFDATGKRTGSLGFLQDITDRKQAEVALRNSFEQVRRALEGTVGAIAETVEKRDPYTAGHQRGVAKLAVAIAQALQLSSQQIEGIRVAGILHDIGKMYIPAEILTKPTKLTELEFNLIKTHAESGYDILKGIEFPWPVAQIVFQHHERLNGSGYPKGLPEEAILLEAKIIAVADVVEAMASNRPYRPMLGVEVALDEIAKNCHILYDARIVDICIALFREKNFTFL